MVQFGHIIEELSYSEWDGNYLQYKQLKKALKRLTPEALSSEIYQGGFVSLLDNELRKISSFYQTKEIELLNKIDLLEPQRKKVARDNNADKETAERLLSSYNAVGIFLVDLLDYLYLNATGIRKILKKHDKAIQKMGAKGLNPWLTTSFLSDRMNSPESDLRKLVASEQVTLATTKIEYAVTSLREIVLMKSGENRLKLVSQTLYSTPSIVSDIRVAKQRAMSSSRLLNWLSNQSLVASDDSDEDKEVGKVFDRKKKIKAIQEKQNDLKTPPSSPPPPPPPSLPPNLSNFAQSPHRKIDKDKLHEGNPVSRFLCLISIFFFMLNYSILIPNINNFVTTIQPGDEFKYSTGLILAATPLGAVLASPLWAKASGKSYKVPMVLACLLCILGNVTFALAFDHKSFVLAYVGRFIVGLGSIRVVNHRFLNETAQSKNTKKWLGVGVVMASVAGSILGPLLSVAFDDMEVSPDGSSNIACFGSTCNYLTLVGWIPVYCWLVTLVFVGTCFKDISFDKDKTNISIASPSLISRNELRSPLLVEKASENILLSSPLRGNGDIEDDRSSVGSILSEMDHNDGDDEGGFFAHTKNRSYIPLLISFALIRIWQEILFNLSPIVSSRAFSWSVAEVGLFLALLSGVIIPVNLAFGSLRTQRLTQSADNCSLVVAQTLVITGFVIVLFVLQKANISLLYVLGSVIVMIGSQINESLILDRLSRAFPPSMRKGDWNSYFFLTEAGYLGRLVANIFLTLAFLQQDLTSYLYIIFLPLICIAFLFLVSSIFQISRQHSKENKV